MVDGGLLVVSNHIVDDTQIDVSQKLPSDVSDFLMLHVVCDGVVIVDWFDVSKLHEVYSDAVVGKGLSMYVTNSSTYLQELLVLLDGLFELA